MHVVRFLKSDHSAPSGGRLNLNKNSDFGTSDFHLCGRRFLKSCLAEFNETMHNNYMEGANDARLLSYFTGKRDFNRKILTSREKPLCWKMFCLVTSWENDCQKTGMEPLIRGPLIVQESLVPE